MSFPLSFEGASESDWGRSYSEPSQLIWYADEILEPSPKLACTDEARPKTQPTDSTSSKYSDPGDFVSIQLAEELGRMGVDGERVQQPSPSKESMISGTDNGGKDNGVDKATGCFCTSHLEDDGEGRCRRSFGGKVGIVVRHVEANEKDGEDIEE